MSDKELARLKVIQDLIERSITPAHAALLLGLTTRRVRTLRCRFLECGAAGLTSRHRGRASNRTTPVLFKNQVMELIRTHYHDFGPTFAAQKLKEKHGLAFSPNTIRTWMKAEGLWLDRRKRRQTVHQPRYRRECYGELVQIDGSEHYWFEDRGPPCTLLVYIDDATSRLMQLKFVQSESAFSYFAATTEYIQRHCKPVAFYSDKHSIFRITRKDAVTGDGMTQFGRALHELNIDIICANTPQAKGRVERANRTLQDRLVKELRLQGISTLEAANGFLPEFVDDYNHRFGKEAVNPKDLHRPVRPGEDLREVFAWREERTVSGSLTLQYDRMVFILEPSDYAKGLVRKRVTVKDYPDGSLLISHEGLPLPYRKFDKVRMVPQGAIIDNKRLGATLEVIKAAQQKNGVYRSQHAPRRLDQSDSLFTPPNKSMSELKKRRRQIKQVAKQTTITPPVPKVEALAPLGTSDRLPLRFSADNSFDGLDLDTQIMLEQMAIRNQRADAKRRALNRQRYWSQRKYLKALKEDADHQEAA